MKFFAMIPLALIALAHPAQAKILFLDLNDASDEVRAARAEAARRHEEIDVVPDYSYLSQAKQARLEANKREYSRLRGIMTAEVERRGFGSYPKRLAELENWFNKYRIEDIAKALQPHAAGTTTLIISGHANGTSVQGVFYKGNLARMELVEAIRSSGVLSTLQSLYMWGCYTISSGSAEAWQSYFENPNLYVQGYGTRSDLNESGQSGAKLAAALRKEMRFRAEKDPRERQKIVESENLGDPRHKLNVLYQDRFYCTKDRCFGTLEELKMSCSGKLDFLYNQYKDHFRPYQYGLKPIPEDSDKTPLRKFYQLLQDSVGCVAQCTDAAQKVAGDGDLLDPEVLKAANQTEDEYLINDYYSIPCPSAAIAVIKAPHVFHNFLRYYRPEFEAFRSVLATLPPVEEACRKFLTGEFTDDRSVLEYLSEYRCMNRELSKYPRAVQDAIERAVSRARHMLVRGHSVPFSWIDETTMPETPVLWRENRRAPDYTKITTLDELKQPDPPAPVVNPAPVINPAPPKQ